MVVVGTGTWGQEPVPKTTNPVSKTTNPVSKTTNPVPKTAKPVPKISLDSCPYVPVISTSMCI